MERNIPDVRDIFGGYKIDDGKQDLCIYDHSPRSRRRTGRKISEYIEDDTSDSMDDGHLNISNGRAGHEKRHEKRNNRSVNNEEYKSERNKKEYSTKTLTDRDIRHLERHLSMKKTIRKQISRNLAKAFVEDPKALQNDTPQMPTPNHQAKQREVDQCFTLTRAKLAKSEQNVLDMLKECRDPETDSGHSSPVHHSSCEDEATLNDDYEQQRVKSRQNRMIEEPQKLQTRKDPTPNNESRFSFWRMFNVLGRGKR